MQIANRQKCGKKSWFSGKNAVAIGFKEKSDGWQSCFRRIRIELVTFVLLHDIADAGERDMSTQYDVSFFAHGLQECHAGLLGLFLVGVE